MCANLRELCKINMHDFLRTIEKGRARGILEVILVGTSSCDTKRADNQTGDTQSRVSACLP